MQINWLCIFTAIASFDNHSIYNLWLLGIIILISIYTKICQKQQNNLNINFNKKTTLRSKFKRSKLPDLNLGLNVLEVSSSLVLKVKLSKDILASAYYCFRLFSNVLSKFVSPVINPKLKF
jgi:hypothetical protein